MKYLYIHLVFILFFISCEDRHPAFNTPKNIELDSLSLYFNLANTDTLSTEERKKYIQKILKKISGNKNDSLNRSEYFKVANRYFNVGDLDNYKHITTIVLRKSEEVGDSLSIAKGYRYLSDYYIKKFIPDSAYIYNSKSIKLYSKLKDKLNIGVTLLNKAILQHNQRDFLSSERTVFEALKNLRDVDNPELIYEAYNLLGLIFGELNEYELSNLYYNKAIVILDNNPIPKEYHLKAITLNNLGLLYINKKDFKKANELFYEGLSEKNVAIDRPNVYATLLDNHAYSKFEMADLIDLPNLFYESLKIKDSLNNINGIILSKIHLSEYYAFKKDTTKAFQFANEANTLANENNEIRDQLSTLKQLANVDPKNALKYSTEYFKINDSLQTAERKARNKFARIEYETEELTIEKDKLIEQRKTLIYIALGIIVIGIFIFVIRFQIAKNRELTLVQEQQKANEEIYQLMINQQNKVEEVRQAEKKRIAQELHDGILGKLFGTRMNLGVLNTKTDEKGISDRSGYIDELKTLEQEIREISHDLNSEKAAVFNNFVLMVNSFIATQKTVCTAKIASSIEPKIEWTMIDNMAKINFYRILQEAFQNINKYAEAQNVSVAFTKNENSIILKIEDDGIGLIYSKKKKGIGLQNMNSRITSSGGTMQVVSEPGNGTTLIFELPLHTKQTPNLT